MVSSHHPPTKASAFRIQLLFLSLVALLGIARATDPKTVEYTDDDGTSILLLDDRKPALYTQNFGDCLGSSAINVTRFDAAYYQDNMTVTFHLQGNTAVANESLMRAWCVILARIQADSLQCTLASLPTAKLVLI